MTRTAPASRRCLREDPEIRPHARFQTKQDGGEDQQARSPSSPAPIAGGRKCPAGTAKAETCRCRRKRTEPARPPAPGLARRKGPPGLRQPTGKEASFATNKGSSKTEHVFSATPCGLRELGMRRKPSRASPHNRRKRHQPPYEGAEHMSASNALQECRERFHKQ